MSDDVTLVTGDNELQGRVEWTVVPWTVVKCVQLTMEFSPTTFQTGRLLPEQARQLAVMLLRAADETEAKVPP